MKTISKISLSFSQNIWTLFYPSLYKFIYHMIFNLYNRCIFKYHRQIFEWNNVLDYLNNSFIIKSLLIKNIQDICFSEEIKYLNEKLISKIHLLYDFQWRIISKKFYFELNKIFENQSDLSNSFIIWYSIKFKIKYLF